MPVALARVGVLFVGIENYHKKPMAVSVSSPFLSLSSTCHLLYREGFSTFFSLKRKIVEQELDCERECCQDTQKYPVAESPLETLERV